MGALRNGTLEKRLQSRCTEVISTHGAAMRQLMHEVGACWVQSLRPSLIAGHEGFSSRHHGIRPSLHRKHMHTLKDEQAVERGQTQDFNCRAVSK